MINVINEYYYFDLDVIEKMVNIEKESESGSTEQHISIVKYEMLKIMIETVLSESSDIDEKIASSELSIPFKLSFNTLLNNKIINKY
jgi:hypothetical protein